MAEALVLVCDRCGDAAQEAVSLRVGGRSLVIDLCKRHLDELLAGSRVPKRGRKPNTLSIGSSARRKPAQAGARKAGRRSKKKTRKSASTRA